MHLVDIEYELNILRVELFVIVLDIFGGILEKDILNVTANV